MLRTESNFLFIQYKYKIIIIIFRVDKNATRNIFYDIVIYPKIKLIQWIVSFQETFQDLVNFESHIIVILLTISRDNQQCKYALEQQINVKDFV